jgi:hypothetical protein
VVLDGVVAGALGIGAIAAVADGSPGGGLAAALIGSLFVGSAVVGHRAANRCEEAMKGVRLEVTGGADGTGTGPGTGTATATATGTGTATGIEIGAAGGAAGDGWHPKPAAASTTKRANARRLLSSSIS